VLGFKLEGNLVCFNARISTVACEESELNFRLLKTNLIESIRIADRASLFSVVLLLLCVPVFNDSQELFTSSPFFWIAYRHPPVVDCYLRAVQLFCAKRSIQSRLSVSVRAKKVEKNTGR